MAGRSRRVRALFTLLAIPNLVAACDGETQRPEPPDDVAYMDDVSGGDDAAIEGRLAVTEGCLWLEGGAWAIVPIFPDRGIAWDGDILKVGDNEFPLNVDLTLGGGGYEGAAPEGATIPHSCTDAEGFWVVNLD